MLSVLGQCMCSQFDKYLAEKHIAEKCSNNMLMFFNALSNAPQLYQAQLSFCQ